MRNMRAGAPAPPPLPPSPKAPKAPTATTTTPSQHGGNCKTDAWASVSPLSDRPPARHPPASLRSPRHPTQGWLILRGSPANPLVYGVLFAIVAGMMVYISLHELLPTALRYDPTNRYTTRGAAVGMLVMGASLLLFQT